MPLDEIILQFRDRDFQFTSAVVPIVVLLAILSTGCSGIDGKVRSVFDSSAAHDFKRSEIISNGPAVADGRSELLVVIQLTNSNGSPVKLFKPTYEIVSGAGVTASECTTSNANGVSVCVLKSTQPGTKRLSVTNIKVELEKDVFFTAPNGQLIVGLISAGQKLTSGHYELSGTFGSQEPGVRRTNGAYTLYGGVQGAVYSR